MIMRRLSAILFAFVVMSSMALAETVNITFLLTNDIDKFAGEETRGGVGRLNAIVKAERAKGHVVYVHAGDTISPSLLSGLDKGEHMIALFNMAPPDAFTPGNHEYDFGPEIFLKRMSEAKFPLLAANLRDASGKLIPGFSDTTMIERGGVKIGIVGLTNDESHVVSSPGDLKIANATETGITAAKQLRDGGADLVVALTHSGRFEDNEMLASHAFDLILSGHDQDLLAQYDGRTAMAESYEQADYVIAIDLTVDVEDKDGKRTVAWHPNFRIIDTATVTSDPETQAKIDELNAELGKELAVAIGSTATPLDSRRATVRTGEAAIGNLIADAARAAVGADIAITNGGGIRGNKEYPAGSKLTRGDVLTELPFGNKNVKVEITGQAVQAALENGVSQVEKVAGRFPQVSGLAFTYDPAKPPGQRVTAVTIAGAPLDPAKTYTLATNDYMLGGGDGYTAFKDAKIILNARDAKLLANDVMVYVREKGEIAPKLEGRITVK
ncbi:MAG: bifunctional UDP-sugar hydrolase/5'-nucleotidase [Hyphomicrobiales bacterium]